MKQINIFIVFGNLFLISSLMLVFLMPPVLAKRKQVQTMQGSDTKYNLLQPKR